MTPVQELSGPIDPTRVLVFLGVFQTLWLIFRRVRTFAGLASNSSLGSYSLVIRPLRLLARGASWFFGAWVFVLVFGIFDVAFNGTVAALSIGFFIAQAVNLFISRYERNFLERIGVEN